MHLENYVIHKSHMTYMLHDQSGRHAEHPSVAHFKFIPCATYVSN